MTEQNIQGIREHMIINGKAVEISHGDRIPVYLRYSTYRPLIIFNVNALKAVVSS